MKKNFLFTFSRSNVTIRRSFVDSRKLVDKNDDDDDDDEEETKMEKLDDLQMIINITCETLKRLSSNIEEIKTILMTKDEQIKTLTEEVEIYKSVADLIHKAMRKRRKKIGISAEPVKSDLLIRRINKDIRSRILIKEAILANDFMKHLSMAQIEEIVDCMFPIAFERGSTIVREGDVGSTVFVLDGE
uniref:cAMP-dependent protein kinase type II-alpha regulatory subunit n=1 Tax=Vespula pensylvanica TaxID=30213 RepID=A0A834NRN0_VESPE|nr:hypothetical protein H0235_011169 [Vespula pensylvanica]